MFNEIILKGFLRTGHENVTDGLADEHADQECPVRGEETLNSLIDTCYIKY